MGPLMAVLLRLKSPERIDTTLSLVIIEHEYDGTITDN